MYQVAQVKLNENILNFKENIEYEDEASLSHEKIRSEVNEILSKNCMENLAYLSSILTTSYENKTEVKLSMKYEVTKQQYIRGMKKLNDWIKENIKDGMTDYEKVKLIHDYIANKAEYITSSKEYNVYTWLSILIGKGGVCDAYSNLFYEMCRKANLEVRILSNKDHSWNKVKVDGVWYNVDVTWDDPIENSEFNYIYFLRSDSFIAKSRKKPSENFEKAYKDYPRSKIKYTNGEGLIENIEDLKKALKEKSSKQREFKIFYDGVIDGETIFDIIRKTIGDNKVYNVNIVDDKFGKMIYINIK